MFHGKFFCRGTLFGENESPCLPTFGRIDKSIWYDIRLRLADSERRDNYDASRQLEEDFLNGTSFSI
jgi:hypothetical protein